MNNIIEEDKVLTKNDVAELFAQMEKNKNELMTLLEGDWFLSEDDMFEILCGQHIINSYNLFKTFYNIKHRLDNKSYWKGLAYAYTSSGNLYYWIDEVKECFSSDRPQCDMLMTDEEKTYYDKLPEILMIHRAMTKEEANNGSFGVSWTLRKSVAEFFRDGYIGNKATLDMEKTILKKIVRKDQLVAVFLGREEFEVILLDN